MNWYYAEAGKQNGPVSDDQLRELVRTQVISADTLVWHEGLSAWTPYRAVQLAAPATGQPETPGAAPAGQAAPSGVCAECGRMFDLQDMIRHGNVYICATCKPILMQKLAEGAKLNDGLMDYAGFWTRFAATFIDGILLGVVNMLISFASGMTLGQAVGVEPQGMLVLQVILFFVQIAISLLYEVIMVGKYGATLGKMACKIRVVTADGGRVSYMRSLGRHFAKVLSSLICLIGYIMAGFDEQKRALHDHICSTRVIHN